MEKMAATPTVPQAWLLSPRLTIACLIGATILGLLARMNENPLQPLDDAVRDLFYLHDSEQVAWFSRLFLSSPGDVMTGIGLGVLFTLLLLRSGHRASALAYVVALLLTWLASVSLKLMVGRPRPDFGIEMATLAWPSGHTMLATVLWGMLLFAVLPMLTKSGGSLTNMLETRMATRIWLCIVVVTACARMLAGVHWISDVIGGAIIGILILQFALRLEQHLLGR
jgi:undecaprenyl-diphosphatase